MAKKGQKFKKYDNLKISISQVGECYDNAQMEIVSGTSKMTIIRFLIRKLNMTLRKYD